MNSKIRQPGNSKKARVQSGIPSHSALKIREQATLKIGGPEDGADRFSYRRLCTLIQKNPKLKLIRVDFGKLQQLSKSDLEELLESRKYADRFNKQFIFENFSATVEDFLASAGFRRPPARSWDPF